MPKRRSLRSRDPGKYIFDTKCKILLIETLLQMLFTTKRKKLEHLMRSVISQITRFGKTLRNCLMNFILNLKFPLG
jgi:hypothetical protein